MKFDRTDVEVHTFTPFRLEVTVESEEERDLFINLVQRMKVRVHPTGKYIHILDGMEQQLRK